MKAFIVDDEIDCREIVRMLLNIQFPQIKVIHEASNINDAVDFLNNNRIDLLFLDIQLNEGTGFDILRKIDNIDFDIIFITAFNQFAIEAIRNNALDYLLKPIDRDEFNSAIQKAISKNIKREKSQLEGLLNEIPAINEPGVLRKEDTKENQKIVLLVGNVYELIELKTIIRCKSDSNYTEFYLLDNRKIVVSKGLKYFEEILTQFDFIRVHQSHIVNLEYVKSVEKGKYSYIHLKDGTAVEISLSRKLELFKRLGV